MSSCGAPGGGTRTVVQSFGKGSDPDEADSSRHCAGPVRHGGGSAGAYQARLAIERAQDRRRLRGFLVFSSLAAWVCSAAGITTDSAFAVSAMNYIVIFLLSSKPFPF